MAKSINEVFRDEAADLKIDGRLIKSIEKYLTKLTNLTDENLHFLGESLIGVYPFRFPTVFQNEWWDDVLDLDELTIQSRIKEHFGSPDNDLDANWHICTNATNLSFVYVAHRMLTTPKLSDKEKVRGASACLKLLQFKLVSSMDAHFFPYPADPSVARAVYASLSKKFMLKKHANWTAIVNYRTEDLLSKDSIHNEFIQKFGPDKRIVYLLNDVQGRYKDIYKRYTTLFYEFKEQDVRIQSINSHIELSGEMTVRDKSNNYSKYRTVAHTVASSPQTLMREKIFSIISEVSHTAPPDQIKMALNWMASNYGAPRVGYIQEFIELVITHACDYIREEKLALSELPKILIKLRGIHLASRKTDDRVLKISELGEKIVKESISSKNDAVHSSVRGAMILYVVLRTLANDNVK